MGDKENILNELQQATDAVNISSFSDETTMPEDRDPPVIVGEVEIIATSTSVRFAFDTNEPAGFALLADGIEVYRNLNLEFSHSVTFSGLQPDTEATYTILLIDSVENINYNAASGSVSTLPDPGSGTSILLPLVNRRYITWAFEKKEVCGQFVNGDWWGLGPLVITGIGPGSKSGARSSNGSQLNPIPQKIQGYESEAQKGAGNTSGMVYRPELNVGLDVSAAKPLVLQQGSSLVTAFSRAKPTDEPYRPFLQSAEVFTVLDSAPPYGSFRPPFCGDNKMIRFNVDQIKWDLLKSLPSEPNAPTLERVASIASPPWIEHGVGWQGSHMRPFNNQHMYGRNRMTNSGLAFLWVHTDVPLEDKKPVVVGLIQAGIDMYGVLKTFVDAGGNSQLRESPFGANGGHHQGSKWPIIFAGLMLDNDAMINVERDYPMSFQEDQQTWFVTQADVGRDTSRANNRGGTPTTWKPEDVGNAEWGIQHLQEPWKDNESWGAIYRQCCTANSSHGHILAALLMGAKDVWAHSALFAYTDRYTEIQDGQEPDWFLSWDKTGWTMAMWRKYRQTV